MDRPHEELRPEYNGLTIDQVNDRLHGHYEALLLIQLHDAGMEMEYKAAHVHNFGEDLTLGKRVLENEEAAIHFDEQGHQDTTPFMPRQRQEILRKTATLFLYGRGIITDYNITINDCIGKYNALEEQEPSGEDGKPKFLEHKDIMNDLAEIRDTAHENRRSRGLVARTLGRISTFGANLGRNRKRG